MNIAIILVAILTIVAVVLALAGYLLGSNSENKITINDRKVLPVRGDDTLLNALSNEKIFIPSACGGKATCGHCKVIVEQGGGEILATELSFMSNEELSKNVRLACQCKVKEDIKIVIPEELLSVKEYKTEVAEIIQLTHDINQVRFNLIEPKNINFKPGQYAQLEVPGLEVQRAYSIASNPDDTTYVELIIRQVPQGTATTFVHKALEVGDKIRLLGPFGHFYLDEHSSRDIVCIAGGSGKAPIRSILFYLKEHGMNRKVKYFFGARTKKDLYYTEEFQALSKEFPNFQYYPALSEPLPEDNWTGDIGLITNIVDKYCKNLEDDEAYLCGSPGMIDACFKVLEKNGMPAERIYCDKF